MINFIYGNPGTGKTSWIYSQIIKDSQNKQKAILIVPEQFTVAAEREIVKAIHPSSQLFVEVLNFTRLANSLFRIYGGISYNFVTKAHEKLIMWRAIKAALPFLHEYKIMSSDDFSLTDAMLSTYKELTATGVPIATVEEVANKSNNKLFSSKIKDITTICSIYSALLGERFTDTNSELARLSELLQNTNCLSGVNVYIDGFTSFTGIEHNIIREIMRQAQNCSITIGIPSPAYKGIDTVSLRDCSDKLLRDCASLCLKSRRIQLDKNHRTHSEILKTLSADMWEIDKADEQYEPKLHCDSVELLKAADIYDECEFASAKARALIESGYRYKDIAIIARDIDQYRGIIEPALDNMELKYFISEKSDLSVSPIAKFILSAIRVFTHGWRRNDIISHLKTGLCDISTHDSDIFECYTAKWNISGKAFLTENPWSMNPDGYISTRTERGITILEIANNVRSVLIGNLKKYNSMLKAARTYEDMCHATMEYIDSNGVREKMLRLATEYLSDGKTREASDFARMLEVALDSLDYVCESFSKEENADIATFATALKIAFSESDLGSIPTSQDEILLGSANTLRADRIRCAIILGACDGEFPATTDDSGLINFRDREILIENGIPVSGSRESAASDELYYFRRAVSTPSDKLIVFTRGDSEPSVAFTRMINTLPECTVPDTSSLILPRLRSLRSVLEYEPLLKDTDEGEALRRLLDEFDSTKTNFSEIKVSAEKDCIDKDIIRMTVGRDLSLTQSKTELFQNCKFSYSCKYQLCLDDGKRAEFSYSSIGTFIHYIMEKFLYRVYIVNKAPNPEQDEICAIVEDIIENYISEITPDSQNRSARLLHLIERLKVASISMINDLLAELSDSCFKPEFFEMRVGTKEIPSVKIKLRDDATISITGVVDRVDVFRSDGKAYIRVIDYKTGNKIFSVSDIEEGLNLQMLLYIFSLTKGDKQLLNHIFGGEPVAAGITYLSVDSSKKKATRLDSSDNIDEHTSCIKRTGLILENDYVISAVSKSGNDQYLMRSSRKNSFISEENFSLLYDKICDVLAEVGEEMLSGNINAIPKKGKDTCKYCRYGRICRTSQNNIG